MFSANQSMVFSTKKVFKMPKHEFVVLPKNYSEILPRPHCTISKLSMGQKLLNRC